MHSIPLKKEPNNYSKFSVFASSALLQLFFNSNSVSFVEEGRKNISCSRTQGTLATLLRAPFLVLIYPWGLVRELFHNGVRCAYLHFSYITMLPKLKALKINWRFGKSSSNILQHFHTVFLPL